MLLWIPFTLFALTGSSSSPAEHQQLDQHYNDFQRFLRAYGKKYAEASEFLRRFEIFKVCCANVSHSSYISCS